MIPLPKHDRNMMEYWVADMQQDPVVQYVLDSAPFGRLKRISFLGALDYIAPTRRLKKTPRTRAHHSVYVGALANYIATQRGYHDELKRHLVVAGLLHDIGHPPLSHSVEPYLKDLFGMGHHEIGDSLIRGRHPESKKFHFYLSKHLDIDFIAALIDRNISDEQGGDLFSSPINIDTIEGIIRTYRYMSSTTATLNPVLVAKASFVDVSMERHRLLDEFWKLKDFIYSRLINDKIGLMADKYSQAFFLDRREKVNEREMYEDDVRWRQKYHLMFEKLASMASVDEAPEELSGMTVDFIKRKYVISYEEVGSARYECIKENSMHHFSSIAVRRADQILLI